MVVGMVNKLPIGLGRACLPFAAAIRRQIALEPIALPTSGAIGAATTIPSRAETRQIGAEIAVLHK